MPAAPTPRETSKRRSSSARRTSKKDENFDPLDTRAFSHAGLAVLGHGEHEALAVRDYRRGRELAPAAGIIDIGRTVFSCFGSAPTVARLADRLFGNG